MKIDKNEALRRLQSPNNLVNSLGQPPQVVVTHRDGPRAIPRRGAEVPLDVKDSVARLALEARLPQKVIAEKFGISQQAVSSYKTNHIGGRPPDEARKLEHQKRVEDIKDSALLKLMGALGVITPEKIEDLEARDAGKLAKDLASVYNSLGPKDTGQAAPVNLIIYSPELRQESKFKVVDV